MLTIQCVLTVKLSTLKSINLLITYNSNPATSNLAQAIEKILQYWIIPTLFIWTLHTIPHHRIVHRFIIIIIINSMLHHLIRSNPQASILHTYHDSLFKLDIGNSISIGYRYHIILWFTMPYASINYDSLLSLYTNITLDKLF